MPRVTDSFPMAAQLSGTGGNIAKVPCSLGGIFISGASATPTVTVYDDPATGTGTVLVPTFTPAAATFYRLPFRATKGLNVVLGGTVTGVIGWDNAVTP